MQKSQNIGFLKKGPKITQILKAVFQEPFRVR